jgi:hypothetical protein
MSERQDGGERQRLDRAPGERYRRDGGSGTGRPPGPGPAPSGLPVRTRAIVAAVALGDLAGLLYAVVAQLNLGPGLVAVGAFAGWLTGIALIWWGRDAVERPLRAWLAPVLGAWAVLFGLMLDWVYSQVQGGVLGPLDYAAQVHGIVAPLSLAAAALLAAWRAR